MTNSFERYILIDCARRIAARFPAGSHAASELSDWLEKTDLGFDWSPDEDRHRRHGVSDETWMQLRSALEDAAEEVGQPPHDRLHRNAGMLGDYAGLDDIGARIFTLSVRTSMDGPLNELVGNLVGDARVPLEKMICCLAGVPLRAVCRALRRDSVLMRSGLVSMEGASRLGGASVNVSERLLEALELATGGVEDILNRLFDDPGAAEVEWEDFAHLGKAADFAARLLQGAIRDKATGVNLLFYGPPGTGKTEFCRVLAARTNATLHAVGESDDSGEEPSRYERIQQLRLGQRFLTSRGDALVMFDEMEDLLSGLANAPGMFLRSRTSARSKVHINRMLETNPVPTLWTCNDIAGFDPALLRRLTFTIEMPNPAEKVRARIWQRLAGKQGLALEDTTCARLARELPEPPALVANALRAARLGGGGVEDLGLAVRAVGKAMRGGHESAPIADSNGPAFTQALINADTDLAHLTARLAAPEAGRAVSLCLSGLSGTGKSAYARHLARQMGLPVIQKRASDILSKWVGGSERNISDAFTEARDAGAFLIFDEADSLLSSRELAGHSWEVSQVNEMLTWMESHPFPFACTTNLVSRLDPASLRRFTFKLVLHPLTPTQLAKAFERFFDMPAPAGLAALANLTPGDFANVRRRARVLGISEPRDILDELRNESMAKPGTRQLAGFRHANSPAMTGGENGEERGCAMTASRI
jgi:SpoVK/Ycf46/Vps4 family AAA+-type ATPase